MFKLLGVYDKMKKAIVTIKLEIENYSGVGQWNAKETLNDFIKHWLFEGYDVEKNTKGIKIKDWKVKVK